MKAKGNLFWILVLLAAAAAIAYRRSLPPTPAASVPAQAPAPAQSPAPPRAETPAPDDACLAQARNAFRAQRLPSKKGEALESAAVRLRRYRKAVRRCRSRRPSR